jgi:CheY-like chemotaxis protein
MLAGFVLWIAPDEGAPAMPHGNVLVVEDDETIRRLLIEYLRKQSALDVDGARDGAEALHQIGAKKYSVIVLDVMMPRMSGIDFLDSLLALRSDPSVKRLDAPPAVLVVTSVSAEEMPTLALEQRFPSIVRDVFRKPVDMGALAERVEKLLA